MSNSTDTEVCPEEVQEEITEEGVSEEENSGNEINVKAEDNVEEITEDFKSKYIYAMAEMENSRKRFLKEKAELLKYGSKRILEDMLEVVDNFERVKMSLDFGDDPQLKNIGIGIDMVHKHFVDTLEGHGLKEIQSLGQVFDPNFHEAVGNEKDDTKENEIVLKVIQKGYTLHGRILRAAKIIVNNLEA